MSLRVLIVEDQIPAFQSTQRLLQQDGYEITVVTSCADARAAADPFDVGVFHLLLANGLGVDLAEEMVHAGRIARVIFLTSSEDRALTERARGVGVVVHQGDGADLRRAVRGR